MISPKLRKNLAIAFVVATVMVVATALEMSFSRSKVFDSDNRLLFFILINLNVLALLGLVYFAVRNIRNLFEERKKGIVGYRLKTKLVLLLLGMTMAPILLMYLVASELGVRYIDTFFTPKVRKPIESSVEVAKRLYVVERSMSLEVARMALVGMPLPERYKMRRLGEHQDEESQTIAAAYNGEDGTEVISTGQGDIIRAAVPIRSKDSISGVLVIETMLPKSFAENIETISMAYEDYIKLEGRKSFIKSSYLLFLAFFSTLIVFAAILASIRLSNRMIEPVKRLAMATSEVAVGNYQLVVEDDRTDEIGMLVKSFNKMVMQIRDAKESLVHAYVNLQNIVRSIHSGVLTIDNEGRIVSMNEAASELLEVSADDVLGKHYQALLDRIDSVQLMKLVKGIVVKTFREVEQEVKVIIKGRTMVFRILITGLKDHEGAYHGMLVVLDDLTEVIKAQRSYAWQEVARRMAHEIKNPLTPIRLSAERVLRKWEKQSDDLPEVLERSLATIIREVDGLKGLVDEFSKFGKMPEAKLLASDLRDAAVTVKDLYVSTAGVEIVTIVPESPVPVEIDSNLFQRAMINLVDNAIEAIGRKGVVTIRVSAPEDAKRACISVEDSGPGIKDEERERLFQPYFTTKENGTGLGLAIVDKIVKDHGGTIRLKRNEPTGSIFSIELPRID